MVADYTVLTPERVSLEYGIAGIGSRCAAALIDTLLQFAAYIVLGLAYVAAVAVASLTDVVPTSSAVTIVLAAIFIALAFLVALGYFVFFEIIWSGQTPGKRLLHVRVIRENGYPIRPVDSVIRNVVRIIDWLPFFYGVGTLVMLLNARSRRLGDFASGTIVVREGSRQLMSGPPPVSVDQQPRGYALSNADATLVRDFLLRRASMHPTARRHLANRLAVALAQRYHLPQDSSDPDPERFLERIVG